MPESLLARELLGSEAGAIPSLPDAHRGAFERTLRGTVLIEHIASIPKELQQSLASILKSKQYRRIGSGESLTLESRVIAASAHSLDDLSSSGRVVQELAEQLRVLEIRIPPLRDRKEDIIPMAAHLLSLARAEIERETGRPCPVRSLSREALERLRSHSWPGNERELREQILSALRLSSTEELAAEDLLLSLEVSDDMPSFRDAKRSFEHEYVTRVLRICRGNISRAARVAKKDRKDFYDVMRRNEINPQDFRH
jgi:two-component system response regulator GlrR